MDTKTFELKQCFVHLAQDGGCAALEVDEHFWETMDPRLESGRLVSVIRSAEDWPNWEMHPNGDELICQLSGQMTLVLEVGGTCRRLQMSPGEAAIVPANVWHTAEVVEAGEALYVTVGAGTLSRPKSA